jgi:hypothetical protein
MFSQRRVVRPPGGRSVRRAACGRVLRGPPGIRTRIAARRGGGKSGDEPIPGRRRRHRDPRDRRFFRRRRRAGPVRRRDRLDGREHPPLRRSRGGPDGRRASGAARPAFRARRSRELRQTGGGPRHRPPGRAPRAASADGRLQDARARADRGNGCPVRPAGPPRGRGVADRPGRAERRHRGSACRVPARGRAGPSGDGACLGSSRGGGAGGRAIPYQAAGRGEERGT